MSKVSKLAATLAVMPVLATAGVAIADSPGQLTGGSNVLVVKNVTQNGSYASSASATCNDVLKYSVRLHNAAYGGLTNVQVKADLANGTVTATPAEGASAGTSGSVSVSVASGSLAYVNGSTVLYNQNDVAIKTLPDTITTSGVNIGDIAGSTTEFVNYEAKVNCPTTPTPTPTPTPTTPSTPSTPAPTTLVNTGAGDTVGIFAAVAAASAMVYNRVMSRRLSRQ